MKWFRETLQHNRIFVLSLISVSLFAMMDLRNYVYAYQDWEAKEKRLQEISEFLDIPVDELRPDHETVYERVQDLFGIEQEDPVKAAGMKRLQEVLRKHEEQLAANPYLPQIEKVKREHAPSRIEGLVRDVLQLSRPKNGEALPEGSQKALLRGLHYGLKESLELPIDENLPAKAQRKHAEFQAGLNRIMGQVQRVVGETQQEKMVGTVGQKVAELQRLAADGLERKTRRARYLDRGLPNQRVEKTATRKQVTASELNVRPAKMQPSTPLKSVRKDAVHADIQTLAEELKFIPAKIFSWAHDNLEVDPKWGATKSPRGTLKEGLGTAWDQAWLLQQLLIASGVDARLEWGQIQISLDQLQDLTGVEDPWRAGDMMTTGGTPFVLLTQAGQPVAARMDHVWVKAHIDNVPFRGAEKHVAGDTWMRMDPTLKIYDETDGIQLYDKVPFTLENYLLSGTTESPRRVYEDAMWQYIRDNGIQCATLEQVKKVRTIKKEAFPFVPGTLRAKAVRIDGESQAMPAAFQYKIALDVRDTTGNSLLSWSAPWPDIYGKRLELAWPGATADDQAVLDAEGGVFETPPYLVDLKPTLRLNSTVLKEGSAIGSAADIEIYGTLTPPAGDVTDVLFQGQAGERNVFAVDLGTLPQSRLSELQATLNANTASGNVDATEAATLALIGASYMSILSRDIEDLAAWKWQRVLELGTFGTVIQAGDVQTTVSGSPLSFSKGPLVTDVATMPLGFFHIDGKQNFGVETFELVGSQSSYLEGTALDMVVPDETMTAVTFLTRAVRNGQQLHKITGANADTVLAAVELADTVEQEIRSAVSQGKIAWVSDRELQINQWRGSGYVIQDPETGAAGYLGTGGYGVGSGTGQPPRSLVALGTEEWLGFLEGPMQEFLELLGIESSQDVPKTQYGDPVNLSNGNLWVADRDLSLLSWPISLDIERVFNSRNDNSGFFGAGWSSLLDEKLVELPGGAFLLIEADGTEHKFMPYGDGRFESPAGKFLEMDTISEKIQVRDKFGMVSLYGGDGWLETRLDSLGSGIEIRRDASGIPLGISDEKGRSLIDVTVEDGLIIEIQDIGGRSARYSYEKSNLVLVEDIEGGSWHYAYDSKGNLLSRQVPGRGLNHWTYDSLDRCIRHLRPDGSQEHFFYSSGATGVQGAGGFYSYFEYDQIGRATLVTNPFGERLKASWTEDNKLNEVIDWNGGRTSFEYDDKGNVTRKTFPTGEAVVVQYGENSRIERQDWAQGFSLRHEYSSDGRTETVWSSSDTADWDQVETTFFDEFGRPVITEDQCGGRSEWVWSAATGHIEAVNDGTGTRHLSTDILGRITEVRDEEGSLQASFHYTPRGYPEKVMFRGQEIARLEYDIEGQVKTIKLADGKTLAIAYDSLGRQIGSESSAYPDMNISWRLDPDGNVISEKVGDRPWSQNYFDASGRLIGRVDESGGIWTLSYCGNEVSPCETTDPFGQVWKQELDEHGRVAFQSKPNGETIKYTYEPDGSIKAVENGLGQVTAYEHYPDGNLASTTSADLQKFTYFYDSNSALSKLIDQRGNEWLTTKDSRGRMIEYEDPLGHVTKYEYDFDQLSKIVKPSGKEILFSLVDEGGNVKHQVRNGDDVLITEREYGINGHLVGAKSANWSNQFSYDEFGRLQIDRYDSAGIEVGYQYSGVNLTKLSVGNEETAYRYDSMGRVSHIENDLVGSWSFTYDLLGRKDLVEFPNGVRESFSYDAAGNLASKVVSRQGAVLGGVKYLYDLGGRRVEKRVLETGLVETYEYDEVGRLVGMQTNAGETKIYDYDANGNRIFVGTEGSEEYFTFDKSNRLENSRRLDVSSQTESLTKYEWNDDSQLVGLRGPSEEIKLSYNDNGLLSEIELDGTIVHRIEYDGLNRRRFTEGEGGSTEIVSASLFGMPHSVAQLEEGTLTEFNIFAPGVDYPLATVSPEGTRFLHTDGIGSVVLASDVFGRVAGSSSFTPYGSIDDADGNQAASKHLGFTGRETEFSSKGWSFYHYRARHYVPRLGQFLTQDTEMGKLAVPATLNRLAYVHGDPVNLKDPSGRSAVAAKAAFFVFGVAYLFLGFRIANPIFRTLSPIYDSILGFSRPTIHPKYGPEPYWGDVIQTYIHVALGSLLAMVLFFLSGLYMFLGGQMIKTGWASLKQKGPKSFCTTARPMLGALGGAKPGDAAGLGAFTLAVGSACTYALSQWYVSEFTSGLVTRTQLADLATGCTTALVAFKCG